MISTDPSNLQNLSREVVKRTKANQRSNSASFVPSRDTFLNINANRPKVVQRVPAVANTALPTPARYTSLSGMARDSPSICSGIKYEETYPVGWPSAEGGRLSARIRRSCSAASRSRSRFIASFAIISASIEITRRGDPCFFQALNLCRGPARLDQTLCGSARQIFPKNTLIDVALSFRSARNKFVQKRSAILRD